MNDLYIEAPRPSGLTLSEPMQLLLRSLQLSVVGIESGCYWGVYQILSKSRVASLLSLIVRQEELVELMACFYLLACSESPAIPEGLDCSNVEEFCSRRGRQAPCPYRAARALKTLTHRLMDYALVA